MTPQERQMVEDLFDRLSKMESAQRDPDATAAITQGLRSAPNAIYPLVQTVLVQDEALRHADDRIQQLEEQLQKAPQQGQGGGFLDSMRGAVFGQGQSQGSVPNVRPPDTGSRPVWNSGQVLPQPGHYDQGGQGQHDQGYGQQGGYGQSYGGPQAPSGGLMGGGMMGGGLMGGGGGSFLGTAAAAAAGAVGGSLLLNSFRSMTGGSHQSFGDTARATSQSPWTDQSNSNLARDAGVNDIGSSGQRNDNSRAGLFDTADNRDDMDIDDDFSGDNDSDA
jgi:hypothetical protein